MTPEAAERKLRTLVQAYDEMSPADSNVNLHHKEFMRALLELVDGGEFCGCDCLNCDGCLGGGGG